MTLDQLSSLPSEVARAQCVWERDRRIYRAWERGAKAIEIAKRLGLSRAYVSRIILNTKTINICYARLFKKPSPIEKYFADVSDLRRLTRRLNARTYQHRYTLHHMEDRWSEPALKHALRTRIVDGYDELRALGLGHWEK